VRFLVDRCAGARLAQWLRAQGHDVAEVAQQGDDPGDAELLQRAVDDDRILVTIDTDFGLLIFAEERPHRGLVRLPDLTAEARIAVFSDLLARHSSDLEARAIVTVRGGVVRVSRTTPADRREP
jgi:predicted nuclease of predicted toxin-antitoxin system